MPGHLFCGFRVYSWLTRQGKIFINKINVTCVHPEFLPLQSFNFLSHREGEETWFNRSCSNLTNTVPTSLKSNTRDGGSLHAHCARLTLSNQESSIQAQQWDSIWISGLIRVNEIISMHVNISTVHEAKLSFKCVAVTLHKAREQRAHVLFLFPLDNSSDFSAEIL